jgi:hypothetical protein
VHLDYDIAFRNRSLGVRVDYCKTLGVGLIRAHVHDDVAFQSRSFGLCFDYVPFGV